MTPVNDSLVSTGNPTSNSSDYLVELVPLALIEAGDNDRREFNQSELRSLADSIEISGLIQPITLRPHPIENKRLEGRFEIIAGERRFRAHQLLGRDVIPALIRHNESEQAVSEIMLTENLHRSKLNPLDEAHAYHKRMGQFGWSVAQVAQRSKVGPERVRRRLGLLTLCPEVQILVKSGQMALGYAEAMAGLDSFRQRSALKIYGESKRLPTQEEFSRVCAELLAVQSQSAMFELEDLWQAQLQPVGLPGQGQVQTRFKTDPRLPALKTVGVCSTGKAIQSYIQQLEDAGFADEALTVQTLLANLTRGNWVKL